MIASRRRCPRTVLLVAACLVGWPIATGAEATDPASGDVEFVRVHVPSGRLSDVPVSKGRYVPMPTDEFEQAVARFSRPATVLAPRPLADRATYDATIDDRGRLVGTLSFDLSAAAAALTSQMPLGEIDASGGLLRTRDGVGEVVVFGTPDGTLAMRTPGPGTYSCSFVCPATAVGTATVSLPLVPALSVEINVRLPAGLRPIVRAAPEACVVAPTADDGDGAWRIDVSSAPRLVLAFVSRGVRQPRLRVWSHALLHGRQLEVVARVVPDTPWTVGPIALRKDPGFTTTRVRAATPDPLDLVPQASDSRRFEIDVPAALAGTMVPIDVSGVADVQAGTPQLVPTVRPAAERWAGGGLTVAADPDFAIEGLTLEECVVVSPEIAARWPEPPLDVGLRVGPARTGAVAASMHFEQQSAAARVVVRLRPRKAELDSVRVTTVEMSPGAVLGRAACDVRVVAGEAFGVTAKVGDGWFIDSVEAIDWSAVAAAGSESAAADGLRAALAAGGRSIDWRLVRGRGGNELRVGLAEAATRSRPLGLRITGHRRGMPLGGVFLTSEMEMVQLEGESADAAVIDFRVGPEAVIEIGDAPIGVLPIEGRLAALAEPGAPRGRIRGGSRAAPRQARLVERRPPLEAAVDVRLAAGEGRLAESFAFTCRADAGDIDAVVVHFSEPLGDTVDWSLVAPEGATILARRLDAAEGGRGEAARSPAVAESWLVEIRPALGRDVTFRAARAVPFSAPAAATMAWVEGATTTRATIMVVGSEAARPSIVNRRLRELPPTVFAGSDRADVVAEFAYGDALATTPDERDGPALELVPPNASSSGGWAWQESTTAWCHASGRVECETQFEVENRGRRAVTLAVPRGLHLEEIFVDGEAVPFDGVPAVGGDVRVPLAAGRGRATILVRCLGQRTVGAGFWRLEPTTLGIDVPVLARSARIMLPPDLGVAWPAVDPGAAGDWLERLFGAAPRHRPLAHETPSSEGFRAILLPAHGRFAMRDVVVVRRGLVASVAVGAALASAAVTASLLWRRPSAAIIFLIATAIATLWLSPPFVAVARSAWWAALAATWWAGLRRGSRVAMVSAAAGLGCLCHAGGPAAAAEPDVEPYRVYLSADEHGGVALVPEPLFRLLAADESAAASAVRVLGCRVVAGDAAWRFVIEIDAERGGVLVLDQGADGGRWVPSEVGRSVGATVEVRGDGRYAHVVTARPGRSQVELAAVPAVSRVGSVESAVITLPVAARSIVEVAPSASGVPMADPRAWQCESAARDGPWSPVVASTPAGGAFDVSRAARVRLSRSVDPAHPLATTLTAAASLNAVEWRQDGCRLSAAYDIDAGPGIVRSIVIRAHPGLAPWGDTAKKLRPLGSGRHLMDLPQPTMGRTRVELAFRMPFDDAAGVFDVPTAWLEGVGNDVRTVRCLADPDLDVTPEMPPGVALLRPRDEDGPEAVAVWRSETVPVPGPPGWPGTTNEVSRGVARVAVRRRPQPHRVGHELAVEFAEDHVGFSLDCHIEAASPLVELPIDVPKAATIDRLTLVEEGDRDEEPLDLFWSRPAPTRVVAIVQRPRPGRFRLVMQARIPGRPAASGAMPIARCGMPAGVPLVVTWRSATGLDVEVAPAAAAAAGGPAGERSAGVDAAEFREIPPGVAGPVYSLRETPSGDARAVEPASPSDEDMSAMIDAGVEATTIHLAFDLRGRSWGVARFNVVSSDATVQLRVPAGCRLFGVLVDGRETQADPRSADVWDVRLHDVRWPRTLVAVFAGDVGGRPDDGGAVMLRPPSIENLPCREVLWSIDPPAGMQARVAPPARVLDAVAWGEAQAAVRQRVGAMFEAALRATTDIERKRLEVFAAERSEDHLPALEGEWQRIAAATASQGRVRFATGAGEPAVIRVARIPDATTPSRGLATIAFVAALAVGWSLAGRWPGAWSAVIGAVWPWGAVIAGGLWIATLTPAIPGLLLVVIGGLAVATWWQDARAGTPPSVPAVAVQPGSESTQTYLLP